MIFVSDRACQRLKDVLVEQCLNAGLGFRVSGVNIESGFKSLNIKVDTLRAGDNVVYLNDGFKLFLDLETKTLLGDCELDYIDEPASGFLMRVK